MTITPLRDATELAIAVKYCKPLFVRLSGKGWVVVESNRDISTKYISELISGNVGVQAA